MKILLINPNISESVTALIEAEAKRAAQETTEVFTQTVQSGVAYIETPGEAVIASYATFDLLAQCHQQYDGVVVAAFGDPGVAQAKEVFPIPVIGLTEAALASAFLLGGRFAIVGISKRIGYWYEEVIANLGLTRRYAGYSGLGQAFADVGTVREDARAILLELCLQRVAEGADSIILAGAPLAGLARDIEADVPVPLIDGVGSAMRMAEAMVRAGFGARKIGSMSPPPIKPYKNLPMHLAELVGRDQAGEV